MGNSLKDKKIDTPKLVLFVLTEIFTVISLIMISMTGEWTRTALTALTIAFVPLPFLVEYLFRQKLTLPAFIIGLTYSIGPMLGHTYDLYISLPLWDKFLHLSAGIIFSLLGIELARKLCRGKDIEVSFWLLALFGLCCSMALSVAWEFVEYALDLGLGLDTQTDTVITSILSVKLNQNPEFNGVIKDINEVVVNGKPLGIGGYLDIGLHDTMQDLMIESLGALIGMLPIIIRKGRHTVFRREVKA